MTWQSRGPSPEGHVAGRAARGWEASRKGRRKAKAANQKRL